MERNEIVSGSAGVLNELEEIEQNILSIMQISQETLTELEKIPQCDQEKLNQLSDKYLSLVSNVKSGLLKNSSYIKPYHPYSQGNYGLKREVDVAEAALRLIQEP